MARYKVLETGGTNFMELCENGRSGEVGTSGSRAIALKGLQKNLELAMNAAKSFQLASRTPQSTNAKSVKDLVAFHTAQQTHVKEAEQARLNEVAIRLRTWLSRQGAWFSGESGLNEDMTMRPKMVVVYDNQLAQQNLTKLSINGGLLRTADGKLFDTSGLVTHFSGPGYAIYVMSCSGHLHAGSHSVGHRHHSSFLGGAPVFGAGEIKAEGGRITFLSNKSGHYVPGRNQLLAVLAMLQQGGVALDFRLKMISPTCFQGIDYPSVDVFMKQNKLDDASINQAVQDVGYIESRVISHSAYYQDTPNSPPAPRGSGPARMNDVGAYNNYGGANENNGDSYNNNSDALNKVIQAAYYN